MGNIKLGIILELIGTIGYHCFFIIGVVTTKLRWILLSFISLVLLFIGFLITT